MDAFLGLMFFAILILILGIWHFDRRSVSLRHYLVTARQQRDLAREELHQTRLERDAITQSVREGILLIDTDEQITFINDAAKRILDLPAQDKISLADFNWWLDLHPLVSDIIAHRAESLGQTIVKDERAFQVSVHALSTSQVAAIVLIDEVTELQRLGRVRRDFVANISHELRTPVTSLRLLTDTLSKELTTNPSMALELVAKLRQQVDVLHQLTDEMMGLALIESGQMPIRLIETRVIDLVDPALETLQAQAQLKRIQIELQIAPDLCALADPEGMRKVFNNLLHNAIKFTPSQGRITVSACPIDEYVQVEIADTGIGILPRDLPRIFERFYKADSARTASGSRGTGLGLAIAKHIVEGHGGTIWAESVEGKGSTFYFKLPACGEPAQE